MGGTTTTKRRSASLYRRCGTWWVGERRHGLRDSGGTALWEGAARSLVGIVHHHPVHAPDPCLPCSPQAFNETSRNIIVETPGLVEAIRFTLLTSESTKTKEVAKGALWTLGES